MAKVTFNVGGRIFTTFRETIDKYPESVLSKMIGPLGKPDEQGIYFLDRDPKCFSAVLNFYRTNLLLCPPNIDLELFDHEMEFWGIEGSPEKRESRVIERLLNLTNLIFDPPKSYDKIIFEQVLRMIKTSFSRRRKTIHILDNKGKDSNDLLYHQKTITKYFRPSSTDIITIQCPVDLATIKALQESSGCDLSSFDFSASSYCHILTYNF